MLDLMLDLMLNLILIIITSYYRVLPFAQDQPWQDGCVKYTCDEDIRSLQHGREHRSSTSGCVFQTQEPTASVMDQQLQEQGQADAYGQPE